MWAALVLGVFVGAGGGVACLMRRASAVIYRCFFRLEFCYELRGVHAVFL